MFQLGDESTPTADDSKKESSHDVVVLGDEGGKLPKLFGSRNAFQRLQDLASGLSLRVSKKTSIPLAHQSSLDTEVSAYLVDSSQILNILQLPRLVMLIADNTKLRPTVLITDIRRTKVY
jgi:succinylarginine dihydrolase